jgi:hypothetical protein
VRKHNWNRGSCDEFDHPPLEGEGDAKRTK